jgi:CHRD domain
MTSETKSSRGRASGGYGPRGRVARAVALPAVAALAGLTIAGTVAAMPGRAPAAGQTATGEIRAEAAAAHAAVHTTAAHTANSATRTQATTPSFFTAALSGANEVPPADPDGSAKATVRIQGTQVCFTVSWNKVAPLTAGHIHAGAAGVNGPVRVLFFGSALPGTLTLAHGCATTDAATTAAIVANPAAFYVNLHNAQFPGGAVRGQLKPAAPADLLSFLRGRLAAVADGGQEIPAADPDGHGTGFVTARGTRVSFALRWGSIGQPTLGHIHAGAVGVNGPVVVTFFGTAIPAGITGVAGVAEGVDAAVVRAVNREPHRHYVNLHNAEFPGGAVRGQLFRAS